MIGVVVIALQYTAKYSTMRKREPKKEQLEDFKNFTTGSRFIRFVKK